MMAKRLHLWRLSNFNIERLPSVEDVYLLHAIARDNPKDERLIACAEVRDVTPVRDETGRIVQLPHLERMLTEAIAGIRLFQSRRPANKRLYWNRILLYVWPPLNLHRDELRDMVQRLAPATEGVGLGASSGTCPHSQSRNRGIARHGSPYFQSRRPAVCSSPSGPPTNCSPSDRWASTSRKSSACASAE